MADIETVRDALSLLECGGIARHTRFAGGAIWVDTGDCSSFTFGELLAFAKAIGTENIRISAMSDSVIMDIGDPAEEGGMRG